MLSDSNARLAAARRLTNRRGRREAGRFLAEGAQAVREALKHPELVVELFATSEAFDRQRALLGAARSAGLPLNELSVKAAGALSETVTPQGLVAVCRTFDLPLDQALARSPGLAAMLVEATDPGNAGTIVRTADAAGATLVILAGNSVDPYNGKAVRATAGSLFHVDIVIAGDPVPAVAACGAAGLQVLATTGAGDTDLDALLEDGSLARRTVWLFGNEARGLPDEVIAAAEARVRVPIYGQAESLNLAAAAAVCLYSSARERRR